MICRSSLCIDAYIVSSPRGIRRFGQQRGRACGTGLNTGANVASWTIPKPTRSCSTTGMPCVKMPTPTTTTTERESRAQIVELEQASKSRGSITTNHQRVRCCFQSVCVRACVPSFLFPCVYIGWYKRRACKRAQCFLPRSSRVPRGPTSPVVPLPLASLSRASVSTPLTPRGPTGPSLPHSLFVRPPVLGTTFGSQTHHITPDSV